MAACRHCGLTAPAGAAFCCAGCEAVASFISGIGLADYYRLRQALPATPVPGASAAELALYDDSAIQSRFARDTAPGVREARLIVEGMRCTACAWLVENVVARTPGVRSVEVNYSTRSARLSWDAETARVSEVFAAIARAGYKAWPHEEGRLAAVEERERRVLLRRLLVAALGMMQVMMYAFPAYVAAESDIGSDAASLMRWSGLILTLPVMAYSAAPFFEGAWRDLRLARLGVDVPVALGLAVAFAASVAATRSGTGAVYFDSVAMFVFLLTLGRYLEQRARARAGLSLRRLGALIPAVALRVTDEASLDSEPVPAALLRVGDRVLVRTGDAVPADGVLASDEATLSEALLSGESRLLARERGERVVGGSVNSGAPFIVRVTHAGADTVLSSIRRMMEEAASARPRWVEAAERASGWFVGLILLAALAAALTWLAVDPPRALWVAVSVLIVTCPCALSLATPVAMTVATGELARRNVVVTRAGAIESLAGVTDFVLDKTGTLTRGEPRLAEARPLADLDRGAMLSLAAALGRGSTHPLDRALAASCPDLAVPPVEGRTPHPGRGIEAVVGGRRTRIGRGDFVAALNGLPVPAVWPHTRDTVLWLGDETRWIGALRLADELRPGARTLVQTLRSQGVEVHLLSGDEREPVDAVARALGIEHVEARASPVRKQAYVRALQLRGARVAMVGDGINDAPVLGEACVSIAMGGGADLAQVRADAVLVSDEPADLAAALVIARRTRAVIRENLAWALAYNLVAIPLAFAGLVTPLIAGIGMASSSLLVVGNALRLRRP